MKKLDYNLLLETLILSIALKHPDISGYGISRLCRNIEIIVSERTINQRVTFLIDEELLIRTAKCKIKITRFGESRLISNKCFIKQMIL